MRVDTRSTFSLISLKPREKIKLSVVITTLALLIFRAVLMIVDSSSSIKAKTLMWFEGAIALSVVLLIRNFPSYHLAKGGMEQRMASGLPPDKKPNFVPLS